MVDRPNTVLVDAVVGRVVVRAPGFQALRVKAVGLPARESSGVFDFTHPRASGTLTDVEIEPTEPSPFLSGVVGHHFRARDVSVRYCVVGFSVWNDHSPVADVVVDRCDVDEMAYFRDDPNYRNGHTRSDCVRVRGGDKVRVTNSRLLALLARGVGDSSRAPHRPSVTGHALLVSQDRSPVSGLLVEGNFLDGGTQSLTLTGSGTVGRVVGNTFGKHQVLLRRGGRSRKTRLAATANPGVEVDWRWNRTEMSETVNLHSTQDP